MDISVSVWTTTEHFCTCRCPIQQQNSTPLPPPRCTQSLHTASADRTTAPPTTGTRTALLQGYKYPPSQQPSLNFLEQSTEGRQPPDPRLFVSRVLTNVTTQPAHTGCTPELQPNRKQTPLLSWRFPLRAALAFHAAQFAYTPKRGSRPEAATSPHGNLQSHCSEQAAPPQPAASCASRDVRGFGASSWMTPSTP